MTFEPTGEERSVKVAAGVTVDGAPVSYLVVLAATVAALALIPLSVVLSSGKSFPLSQAIYPLVGWLLGPVAGALASGIGALIGVFVAPHTTTLPPATVLGAALGSLAAGAMAPDGPRRRWWIPLTLFFGLAYLLYAGRAVVQNGVAPVAVLAGSFIDWSALLLFALPTRSLAGRWLSSPRPTRLSAGLFLGTWMIAGLSHLTAATLVYFVTNWPAPVWLAMAPLAPWEHLVRCVVGSVIGTGVIAGLRATGLVKPRWALY